MSGSWKAIAMALALESLTVCGSRGDGGNTASSLVDTSGFLGDEWPGGWNSPARGSDSLRITINHRDDASVTGTASIDGLGDDFNPGVVIGPTSDANGPGDIAFTISWRNGDTMTFAGTYTSTAMNGGYTRLVTDVGNEDIGTFSLNK